MSQAADLLQRINRIIINATKTFDFVSAIVAVVVAKLSKQVDD